MSESIEIIKLIISAFTATFVPFSIFLAYYQIKQTLEWNKKKAAEEILTQIVSGEIFDFFQIIKEKYRWDILSDNRLYDSIAKNLNSEEKAQLDLLLTKILRYLETITIKIEHSVYNESICFDYLFCILINTYEKCFPFILYARKARSESRLYEHVEKFANKWKKDINIGRTH